MAIDLAPYGIRVNWLPTPAHIRTGITTYEMGPVLRYMQLLEQWEAQFEDVANAVVSSPAIRRHAGDRHRVADRRRDDSGTAVRAKTSPDHVDLAPRGSWRPHVDVLESMHLKTPAR